MNEYRVNLDSYNGPLDLLLYLIRRDELDICDIPIASITEQYTKYVQVLQQVDPNMAGDFLVMAATLLEIKSRLLLPAPPAEEGAPADAGLDPRAELVRQLLQYKAFKDAAADLSAAAAAQAMKFPRKPVLPDVDPTELDMEDVQVWDLVDAFSKILASIGQQARKHEVIYDDTPQELHQADILDRLGREGPLSFSKVFEGRTSRSEIVGLFLALLELVRQKRIVAMQDSSFGDIAIALRPDGALQTPAPAEEPAGQPQGPAAPAPREDAEPQEADEADQADKDFAAELDAIPETPGGEYVSEYPDRKTDNPDGPDDDQPEAQGSGA
jgi:segregation and condensation protein A